MEIDGLIRDFKEYLLTSEINGKIAKIILFGSYAKGIDTADSDIDILIVTTDGKDVDKVLMNRIYEFMIDNNAPLEVITSNIDDFFLFRDYFYYNINRYGTEVFTMEKEEIKKIMLNDIKGLSEEYLESAREVFNNNRIRLSIDAAYNAVELAAKALILLKNDDLPGSHGGVVSLFGQLYVKTGEIEVGIGRRLNTSLKIRNGARYKPNVMLTKEDALDILELAEILIKIIEEKKHLM